MFSLYPHVTRKANPFAASAAQDTPTTTLCTSTSTRGGHLAIASHRTHGFATPTGEPDPAHPAAARRRLEAGKVLWCGLASMLGQGAVFSGTLAMVNFLRLTGNPVIKVAAGGLIAAGGAATAPADQAARALLDCKPTPLDEPTLATDSIASLALLFVNLFYLRAPFLPKFAANTLRGAAATSAVTLTACGVAGAANELAAQWAHAARPTARDSTPPADLTRVAWGRFLSLIPMGLFNQVPAAYITQAGRVPAWAVPLPITVGTAGWTLRRVLMPPEPGACADPPAAQPLSHRQVKHVKTPTDGTPPCEKGPK